MKRSLAFSVAALSLTMLATPAAAQSKPAITLAEWQRGIKLVSSRQQGMEMFLWFYEWTLFDAIQPGEHLNGTYDFYREVSKDRRSAAIKSSMFHLNVAAASDGAELTLKITNISDFDWPELAGIIPCFNPGRQDGGRPNVDYPIPKNSLFGDAQHTHTYILGTSGLLPLANRAIHFNHGLRPKIDLLSKAGQFVFSSKWPPSEDDAAGGLIVRESADGKWVTGIAWEDYLSVQGHNPWNCMHASVRVGPLKTGQSKTVRGKIFLFLGTKDDLLTRYRIAFKK
jgi:hypothetical protein